jgi:hypothetical protein
MLRAASIRAGFTPRVLVARGLQGLRNTAHLAPSYSATFFQDPDSVRGDPTAAGVVEKSTSTIRGAELKSETGPVLMIARDAMDVLAGDVMEIAESRQLPSWGSEAICSTICLPSDRAL